MHSYIRSAKHQYKTSIHITLFQSHQIASLHSTPLYWRPALATAVLEANTGARKGRVKVEDDGVPLSATPERLGLLAAQQGPLWCFERHRFVDCVLHNTLTTEASPKCVVEILLSALLVCGFVTMVGGDWSQVPFEEGPPKHHLVPRL